MGSEVHKMTFENETINEIMVYIEETIGEKLDWGTNDEAGNVIIPRYSLSVIAEWVEGITK